MTHFIQPVQRIAHKMNTNISYSPELSAFILPADVVGFYLGCPNVETFRKYLDSFPRIFGKDLTIDEAKALFYLNHQSIHAETLPNIRQQVGLLQHNQPLDVKGAITQKLQNTLRISAVRAKEHISITFDHATATTTIVRTEAC